MTTTIIVDAHAGWDVKVTPVNNGVRQTPHIVPAMTKQSFAVFDNQTLEIAEVPKVPAAA